MLMAVSDHTLLRTIFTAGVGAAAAWIGIELSARRKRAANGSGTGVTRMDAHLASTAALSRLTPAKSSALQRDVQQVFEHREAAIDLEVLDRALRDIRDLAAADEAIFWRWVENRQTLVPGAWSTEGSARPMYFDTRAWGPRVKWSAEQAAVQVAGEIGRAHV